VADRARQLLLPAADHAGDHRLAEIRVEFVITARLRIQHRCFAPCVIGECERELRSRKMDVDVLPARHQRGGAPTAHAQVSGDRRRKVAGVREDRDGPFAQRLVGTIAAERAANAHAVPRIGDTETIPTEDVDAVLLAHSAYLARIVHGEFFRDDEDLLEFGIHANQFGDTVARRGRWQIDHAAVETVAVLQTLEHVVVHGDIADRRFQHLPTPPRRRAENDVAARIRMANRRDLARLAAEYVQHAHTVFAARRLRKRADANVIFEFTCALSVHGLPPARLGMS